MEEKVTPSDRQAILAYRWLNLPVIRRLRLHGLVFDALGLAMSRAEIFTFIEKLQACENDAAEAQDEHADKRKPDTDD